jgi:hypothetical protein
VTYCFANSAVSLILQIKRTNAVQFWYECDLLEKVVLHLSKCNDSH